MSKIIDSHLYKIKDQAGGLIVAPATAPHLYIMCGASGSGKSTWIEKNLAGYTVISLDEIRHEINGDRQCQDNINDVLKLARARLNEALTAKKSTVWDATNTLKSHRKIICDIGLKHNALITIVVFKLPKSILVTQNRNRSYSVPSFVLNNQIKKMQWPTLTEAHRILTIGEMGEVLSKSYK